MELLKQTKTHMEVHTRKDRPDPFLPLCRDTNRDEKEREACILEPQPQLCPFLPAGQGLSAAFGIQAAVGKWQGCDVKGSGNVFQQML